MLSLDELLALYDPEEADKHSDGGVILLSLTGDFKCFGWVR